MKGQILDEPDLEFALGSRHIDPRHGIEFYGPADVENSAVRTIRVGIVGTRDAIAGVKRWLDSCRSPIARKPSHLTGLFRDFPGFDRAVGFRSTIEWDPRLERQLDKRALEQTRGLNPLHALSEIVGLYAAELSVLDEEPNCDVIIVCRPDTIEGPGIQGGAIGGGAVSPPRRTGDEFRSLLKARSLGLKRPIQIIRQQTWDPSYKPQDRTTLRGQQDTATKAWNLHTALYYKAGGVPWRMVRSSQDLASCYVGVAFYRSNDHETLQTSVAQIFNQRGDGVIVRGAPAVQSKDDRQPHLAGEDAKDLLERALARYRDEHRNLPARVVLHKASSFTPAEIEGFRAAADADRISLLELVWIPRGETFRLFRDGEYPPLRGTLFSFDDQRHALYTRGSVPLYKTYAGMYVPVALPFRLVDVESSPEDIASEILTLSKMNWNSTQLDERLPITLRTASAIGEILKYVPETDAPAGSYAYYM
ncbi:hypothetical protein [Promicromonospora sp. NPDC059942]|uniref:argonaute/piwi family protein n=1 Tax=Promicromonospora sp. NPDC059942 TaxID=3347009 RepID=UPI0036657363